MSDIREGQLLLKSYRYLRISMIGVVLALAVSIGIERLEADCWQPAVSSYFHTPVRAIFVGGLMAIAVSLIVIKGDGRWEDTFFNFAGIMAPMVAVIPTDAFGEACSPSELGVAVRTDDGEWTALLQASIDNNIKALLITGFAGLVVAAVLSVFAKDSFGRPAVTGGIEFRPGLFVTFLLLVVLTGAYLWWDDFSDRAHGWSAVLMFVLLAAGIAANAHQRRQKSERRRYLILYASIVVGMALSALIIWLIPDPWEHRILILEAVEIAWFAAFWIVQTYELWNEPRLPAADVSRTTAPDEYPSEPAGAPEASTQTASSTPVASG